MKKRIVVVVLFLCVILLIFFMPKKNTDEYIKDDSYTHIIGVSVPNITEPWIYDMIQVIEDLKDKKYFDYKIILYESESNSQNQVEDIKTLYEYGMDVLVVVPDESEIVDNKISEIYKEIPVITVGNHCKGEYTCSIRYDDYKIGEMAAEYILEEAYRANNDVFILTEENNFSRSEDIKRGFVDRTKDKIDPDHMTFVDASSLESIADSRMKEYLLLKEKPCVVFGFNDDMAYGAYKAAGCPRPLDQT